MCAWDRFAFSHFPYSSQAKISYSMPLSLLSMTVGGLDTKSPGLACAFSPVGDRCCVSVGSHVEQLTHHGMVAGRTISSAACSGTLLKEPVVSMAFKPEGEYSKVRNVLMLGCADGALVAWHLGSHKPIASVVEADTEIYAVEFTTDGSVLATGGKDSKVRLHDPETLKRVAVLDQGPPGGPSHTSRIQCLCAVDSNCFLSGGWDYTMCLWDARVPKAVSFAFGPYLCGDGIAVFGTSVLTCSGRNDKQVQLWDLRDLTAPTLELTVPPAAGSTVASLYCGAFSPDGGEVVVGGCGILATFGVRGGAFVESPLLGEVHAGSTFAVAGCGPRFASCGSHAFIGEWL